MQDRYTGDVGDFGKYGMLRRLCGLRGLRAADAASLKLGVAWYRTGAEIVAADPANDGKHIGYLCPEQATRFRPCDPDLYDTLREILKRRDRRVAAVEQSGALGPDAMFYDALVPGPRPGARGEARVAGRRRWLRGALDATDGCALVFLDPDNGLEPKSTPITRKAAPKHTYLEEVGGWFGRGQSVVIYHHLGRQSSHQEQIAHWLGRLRDEFDPSDLFALRYGRGMARAFFVLATAEHAGALRERATGLVEPPWGEHFELHG